jgi:enamine deaminase RidA (YjgF/YER057c/UK114 family)
MRAEQILSEMGISLDAIDRKGCSVVPVRRYKDLLFVSGHGSFGLDGEIRGRVGIELNDEQAYEAARLCAVNMLRSLKDYLGDLDRVVEWVKVLGLVNSDGDFYNMPKVINGFSDVITKTFGYRGRHARAAMGSFNHESSYAVVVDAVLRIRD